MKFVASVESCVPQEQQVMRDQICETVRVALLGTYAIEQEQ